MFALAASRIEPRHAYAVAFLHGLDATAHRRHVTDPFMSGNEGQRWLDGPVAISGMQVGMADARRLHVHQDITGTDLRDRAFFDAQRPAELSNDSGFHMAGRTLLERKTSEVLRKRDVRL